MTTLRLPFAELNLRYNPFGELPSGERGNLAVPLVDMERLIDQLKQPGFAVQFLGDEGRGKSTHLLALKKHFPDATYVYFPEDGPHPNIPNEPVLFLDELQRVPVRRRRKLFKRRASWVIGSHFDHQLEFKRGGLRSETCVISGLDSERLHKILSGRIEAARRVDDEPIPEMGKPAIDALLARFGDDIRGIEHHLYGVFQQMKEVQCVEV